MEQGPHGTESRTGDKGRVAAVPIHPHVRSDAIPMLPRSVGLALVVGFLAFVAGVRVGTPYMSGPTGSSVPSASPSEPLRPEQSSFAAAFDPDALSRNSGLPGCPSSGSGRSAGNGRTLSMTFFRCSVPPATQPLVVRQVEQAISTDIRQNATPQSGGFNGSADSVRAPTVVSWNYQSDGLSGSVYLVATYSSTDVQFVITLSEGPPS